MTTRPSQSGCWRAPSPDREVVENDAPRGDLEILQGTAPAKGYAKLQTIRQVLSGSVVVDSLLESLVVERM